MHRRWPDRKAWSCHGFREVDPAPLIVRLDDRIDDLLALGAIVEGTLLRPVFEDFVDEKAHEVAVVELGPRRVERGARRQRSAGDLDRLELDAVGGCELQRFRDPELFDEPCDRRTLAAINTDFDTGIVADGDVTGLQDALRPAG